MSGGYIARQEEGEHQVVIFTFIGPITGAQVTEWNKRVLELKKIFVPKDGKDKKVRSYLAGITVKGERTPTPEEMFPTKKKKKK